MKVATSVLLVATLGLTSCSSIKSVKSPSPAESDGLTYFMPNKDFLVTVTVKGKVPEKVVLGVTAAYPDLSTQYLLRHAGNAFGKSTLDVGVSESGLLASTKSTTESSVTDAFKNLAAIVGQSTAGVDFASKEDVACVTDGEHTFVYKTPGCYGACGLSIEIKKHYDDTGIVSNIKTEKKNRSGVFYRQSLPYLVSASGSGLNVSSIVLSPSQSKTLFLPVSRTFFSNNEADFSFVDGVPTKFKQVTDGEAAALLKLPAEILGAYFGAIGSVFDSFKSNDTKEADALAASLELELQKKKYEECIALIKATDATKLKELACP